MFTTDTPLGVFSQTLTKEEANEALRNFDKFFTENEIIFAYPVHGGFLGYGATKLAFGKYNKYDALAPEFETYNTIKELAQGRRNEMRNFSGLATQIASQFALLGRTTADKRLRYASPKLTSATSFIRKTLSEIARPREKVLHRYEGVFELNEEKIVFDGKDIKEDKKFRLGIPIKSITDLYLGWDDIFTGFPMSRAGDRAYPWNKPLRVKYKSDLEERTIYLFVRFHRKWGIRASDNKEVYKKLKEILGGE